MLSRIIYFREQLPTVHLIAASACLFILCLTLLLLPSEEVEATRGEAPPTFIADKKAINDPLINEKTTSQEQLAVTKASEPPKTWINYTVGSGDNLSTMFKKAGLTARDVYNVSQASKASKSFMRLFPGQTISFAIKNGDLIGLRHVQSKLVSTELSKTKNGYDIQLIELTPVIKERFASATISDSLFLAGEESGLSGKKIMELASIFGWDIDFVLDIRKGDSFNLIYEEQYLNGEKIGEGNIIAAQFINRGTKFTALRYTNSDGDSSYFTPEGYSMRKTFLRSPVDFARVSSRFNLRRKHPVLNKIRAHKGVDYAAGTGTTIKAAGEGKIIYRGRKGGYGNVVILQHGGNITTLYAHMKAFKRGQRIGTRVKQGQAIGFVGKSGLATGPHLHYEFRVNGVHKNPLKVKLPQAAPIAKAEENLFKSTASKLLAQLETYQTNTLAFNDPK
ncbi:MAG: OapA family protein [Neptuniibacter sp.]